MFTQHGSQDYIFSFGDGEAAAIEAATGIRPQTLSLKGAPEFEVPADGGDNGEVEAVAVGPSKVDGTLSGYLIDETTFDACVGFTFREKFYYVSNRGSDTAKKEFRKAEMTVTHYDGVAAPDAGP